MHSVPLSIATSSTKLCKCCDIVRVSSDTIGSLLVLFVIYCFLVFVNYFLSEYSEYSESLVENVV